MEEDDDERHRREEHERRAKRKAGKMSKSEAQLEKERKQKEHRQKILKQHGGSSKVASSSSGASPSRPAPPTSSSKTTELTRSAFQELFSQRAQGFQIDFRFRNAPPRPPVGPTFVGPSIDTVLQDLCQQYKSHNAVDVMYKWKLHSEPDLGVPLAPSAMDLKSYTVTDRQEHTGDSKLHEDDKALLNWTGSMGDTSADKLKMEQERKRIKDRLLLTGKKLPPRSKAQATKQGPSKKGFSRVLNEGMQTWMKKTTYLSNDYTRKVHDFKSLAQTKQEVAVDLQLKQEEMTKRRSATAISQGFAELDQTALIHPARKDLKPFAVFPLLPNVEHWGLSVTHVVLDKVPALKPSQLENMSKAFVGNVEKPPGKVRMSCQVFLPSNKDDTTNTTTEDGIQHDAVQSYDLDVVPLKEEDAPHTNFIISIDRTEKVARYFPISSRVQLSRGRPVRAPGGYCHIIRKPLTEEERLEQEERAAEVNMELAEKHGLSVGGYRLSRKRSKPAATSAAADEEEEVGFMCKKMSTAPDDDGEGDFGDDDDESSDSGDDALFGTGSKTIVAEG